MAREPFGATGHILNNLEIQWLISLIEMQLIWSGYGFRKDCTISVPALLMPYLLGFSREREPIGDIYIYVYEEITRNWLMPLWKLRSYKICSWPAGDPEEVVV